MCFEDRIETLRTAGRNAIEAQDALMAALRNLEPQDFTGLEGRSDVDLIINLILRRIYPVPAFAALARINITAAREVLLSRYLGKAVDPDKKFGGYTFELASMLDELLQAGGEDALIDLINQPDFSPRRLDDPRVVEAFSDALEIESLQLRELISQARRRKDGIG